MLWIIFSLLAALIWGISNVIDKFVMTKYVKNPIVPMLVLGALSLILFPSVFFVFGFSNLSLFNVFVAVIAGGTFVLSNTLYFKLVSMDEISRVIPLFYFEPVFVLVMALFFLNESFSVLTYFGILLLVAGAVMISFNGSVNIKSKKFLSLLFISVLFYAVHSILIKYLLGFSDIMTVFSFERIGVFVFLVPLYLKYFPELKQTLTLHGKKALGIITLSELMGISGMFFVIAALFYGTATLVNALVSVQPFFVLFFSVLMSLFFPEIIKEDIRKSIVFVKFIAIALIFAGAFLIT